MRRPYNTLHFLCNPKGTKLSTPMAVTVKTNKPRQHSASWIPAVPHHGTSTVLRLDTCLVPVLASVVNRQRAVMWQRHVLHAARPEPEINVNAQKLPRRCKSKSGVSSKPKDRMWFNQIYNLIDNEKKNCNFFWNMVLFVTSNISECQFVDQITYQFDPTKLQVRKHGAWKSGATGSNVLPAFQTFCWSGPSSFRLHRLSKRESPLPPRFQARSRCSNRSSKISSSHISVCQAPSGQLEQCSQQIWWWNWCHGTRRSFVPWRHPTNQQQRSELSYTGKPGVPCKVNDPGNLSKLKLKTP